MNPAPRHDGHASEAPVGAAILLVVLLVAACGLASGVPTAGPVSPGPAGSPPASADGELPSPTWWPGGVVEAVLLLGKSDLDVQAAGADLGASASTQDLEAMWGAADGLTRVLVKLPSQVDRIRDYPTTVKLAAAYDAALPDMLAGATKLRDSITAGDAAGIAAGSQQMAKGLEAYSDVRTLLADAVGQAALMQRILVK